MLKGLHQRRYSNGELLSTLRSQLYETSQAIDENVISGRSIHFGTTPSSRHDGKDDRRDSFKTIDPTIKKYLVVHLMPSSQMRGLAAA
jgi:hypothetical protein